MQTTFSSLSLNLKTSQSQATTASKSVSPKAKLQLGLGLAIFSNVLFGIMYLYSSWLAPLSGTQVFLWRMVAMWVGLAVLMAMTGGFAKLTNFTKILTSAKQWAMLLLPTPILASQLWLFMWAPVNHQAVNVAMGYFLFPLSMVLMGFLVFKEKLNRLQMFAVMLALIGVAIQIWQAGTVSWATAWVALTYPIYYTLRRWQGVPSLLGLFIDLSVIAPIALAVLVWQHSSLAIVFGSVSMVALVAGLGVISTLAMHSNLHASSLLPVNLFGMLSYIEPALLFVFSIIFLGETLSLDSLVSFSFIWAGIAVMIANMWYASKNTTQTS